MDAGRPTLESLLSEALPLKFEELKLPTDKSVGLVVVDEVNGFCTVGAGNMAPRAPNGQVAAMVRETDRLCRQFSARGWPILAFLDTHEQGQPEAPYPPHCIRGTGEEKLVPELEWLERDANATLMMKDCINGYVGGMGQAAGGGGNAVEEWAAAGGVRALLAVGICTDICVMDFVVTALSARNHGVLPPVEDVLVYAPACATYDLPRHVAEGLGYGPHAAHPQEATHYMGLYFMYSRGARLIDRITFE